MTQLEELAGPACDLTMISRFMDATVVYLPDR